MAVSMQILTAYSMAAAPEQRRPKHVMLHGRASSLAAHGADTVSSESAQSRSPPKQTLRPLLPPVSHNFAPSLPMTSLENAPLPRPGSLALGLMPALCSPCRPRSTLLVREFVTVTIGLGEIHVLNHGNSRSRVTLKSSHFTFGFTAVTRQNRHFFLRFAGGGYKKSCDPT